MQQWFRFNIIDLFQATSSDDKENKLEKKEVSSPLKELDKPQFIALSYYQLSI